VCVHIRGCWDTEARPLLLQVVLDEIKANPIFVAFADDRFENFIITRSLGMNGIISDDVKRVR
jgi:hypothetical protein